MTNDLFVKNREDSELADGGRGGLIAANKPRHPMEILLKSVGATAVKPGDIVEGTVIEKKGAKLFLDIGALATGIVYGREYRAAQQIVKNLAPGDKVSAKVVEVDNDEGYIELSLQEAGREKRWVDLKRMKDTGEVLELPVMKANSGGLILELMNLEGFLPTSQLSFKNYPRVEGGEKEKIFQELQKFIGTNLRVKILDLDAHENKLIFTEKGLDTERLRTALGKYKVGDVIEGEITGVVDFGAFMKFDDAGLEGLIHLSEIDWTLIEDPREVLKSGERVSAKIIDIQGDKISLSLKQLKDDPWSRVADQYKKGDSIQGKVTKFNPFGTFVQITPDIQGLIHVSEFGTETKMRETLAVGETYTFKILFFDPKEHRMSLGLAPLETGAHSESLRSLTGLAASAASSETADEKKEEAEVTELAG